MNYYISDLHFGHENIIRLSHRPFENAEQMDETIIKNWNNVVKDSDAVYIGGDFCYKSGKHPKEYLERLNGKKHLIVGNHDGSVIKDPVCRKYFESIKDIMNISDGNKRIIICHYPMVEWNGFYRNALHFYGHIHNNTNNNTYKILESIPNCYNIGADVFGFVPRTLDEIINGSK